MIITSAALLDALSVISLIPSVYGINSSEFIRLDKKGSRLTLSLCGQAFGQTYAKGVVDDSEKDWTFFVDRALFTPFINISKDANSKTDFHFTRSKGALLVKCGRRSVAFTDMSEVSGYVTVEPKDDGSELKLSSAQRKMLQIASSYATMDPTAAYLNCVYMQKGTAVLASNQLAHACVVDTVLPMSVPFPLLLLSVFDSNMVKVVRISRKMAKLKFDNGYICQMVNEEAATKFPAKTIHKQLELGAELPKQFVIKAQPLLTAIQRMETCTSTVIKRDLSVTCEGKKGDARLVVVCRAPQGTFKEALPLKKPLRQDIACEWLVSLISPLQAMLSDINNVVVRYDDQKKSAYYIQADGVRLLLSRKS